MSGLDRSARRLARGLAAHWRIPAVLILLGAAAGAAGALAETPEYRAGASVVAADRGEAEAEGYYDTSDPETLDRLVQIARGREVALTAAAALGGDLTGAEVLSRTTISPGAGGSIAVRVSSENRNLPAAVADAYAESIVEVVDDRERSRLRDAEQELGEQLLALDPLSEEFAQLEGRIAEIAELRALGEPLELGQAAGEPAAIGQRSLVSWTAVGALVGLLAGLLCALLIPLAAAVRDRHGSAVDREPIESPEDGVEPAPTATPAPVPEPGAQPDAVGDPARFHEVTGLDPIPLPSLSAALEPGSGELALAGPGGEALRRLAEELGLGDHGEPTSLAIVSASRQEGRTTVALGLAAAAAAAGAKVVLVEGDLRHPVLAEWLELEPSPGLGGFLAGESRPREMVRQVRLAGEGGLLVTVAGAPREDGEELLPGRRLAVLTERLLRSYDVIVLDSPPLLEGGDAGILGDLAERTLLLGLAGSTSAGALRAALPLLPEYLNAALIEEGPAAGPARAEPA